MEVTNVKVANIRPKYKNLKEWMEDPNNVYIGRAGIVFIDGERFPKKPSVWANPYKEKIEGRERCLELYETWLREKIKKEGCHELLALKDKVLGCWCKPKDCHGDILLKVLNSILKIQD